MDYDNDETIDLTPESSGGDANGLDAAPTVGRISDTFKAELARALQIAAGHERDRLEAALGADAERQVERTLTRAAVETDELRRSAEDDETAIRAWSEAEVEKIRSEAACRAEQRETDLRDVLRRHEAIIEVEVAAVATAVKEYETTLVEFFDDMTSSMDLAYIVRQSDLIPEPPSLEMVRADARAETASRFAELDGDTAVDGPGETADGPGIAVMDPAATGATADLSEADPSATSDEDDASTAPEEPSAIPDEVAPSPNDTVAVASANGTAVHENPATRFLRSLGLTPGTAESSGSQPRQ